MTKYSYSLLVCCVLLFSGCQSIEQLSIDYMLPAEVSFPSALRRVAVVNNMPPIPDNKLILEENDEKKKDETEIARKTKYFNGDGKIATESLAEALANENYFDEVIICDSALRAPCCTARYIYIVVWNKLTQSTDVGNNPILTSVIYLALLIRTDTLSIALKSNIYRECIAFCTFSIGLSKCSPSLQLYFG